MAATDNLNHDQLKLFMTGTEWKATVTHSTDGPLDRIWPQKESEARLPGPGAVHGSGVYDSMKKKGYIRPVNHALDPTIVFEDSPSGKEVRRVQSEGHHRVAAAAAIEHDTGKPVYLIPRYVDNTSAARKRRGNNAQAA